MEQLYKELKRKLISVELKPGEKLSENAISSDTGMNRPQVRRILTNLSDEGYLETLPQKGSVVTKIKKNMIREATHAHLVIEQAILSELVNKVKNGEQLSIVNDYVQKLRTIEKPESEYDMVMLEWGFYNSLAKECNRGYSYSFLDKIDCDMYRLSSLKYSTYNYNVYNSSLNAWENTMVEIRLMTEQLKSCQVELLTMICSNRYNGFLVTMDTLEGIYREYFE
jgi:transcriptional regulator, gntR family